MMSMAWEWEAAKFSKRRYRALLPHWPCCWREYLRGMGGGLQVAMSERARRKVVEW